MRALVVAMLFIDCASPATCTRGGRTFRVGERFYDGCNACTCDGNGLPRCTARLCPDGGRAVFCVGANGENRAPHEEWIEYPQFDPDPSGETCFCTTAGDVLCGEGELAGSCEVGLSRFENGYSDATSCGCTCRDGTFTCASCDAGRHG